jgi:transcriptional regulator with GAF, ATPase, and Fis domain
MASLYTFRPGRVRPKGYQVYKHLTVIGAADEDDLCVDEAQLVEGKLNLAHDGARFRVEPLGRGVELSVNGKRRKRHELEDGDVMRVGETLVIFRTADLEASGDEEDQQAAGEKGYTYLSRLADLSARIMAETKLDKVLQLLVDELIDFLDADKGFLILTTEDDPWVTVARNVAGKDIPDEASAWSDSILKAVLETGEPVIVSDALSDTRFSGATSVMSLKLSSVMAAPLKFKGRSLGLLYLGNDNVVNLFTSQDLQVLEVFAGQAAAIVNNALILNELKARVDDLSRQVSTERFGEIIGSCPSMRRVYQRVDKVAPTDVSVLIQGETGSGKELIARELHKRSNRVKGPFMAINCGAIPENLLESELFGYMRGAFTGAVATQPGKFHEASGGTLFLDEIGELPLNLQVKLLRVLQEKQVLRVGATKPEKVDIRVVAATNKDLRVEAEEGRFREDLYYRLNVILVALPPLRERGEDVILIASALLKRFTAEYGSAVTGFTPEAAQALRKHPWPGNIRELENRLKRAVIFASGTLLTVDELEITEEGLPSVQALSQVREDFQMAYVLKVLDMNNGNRTQTARDLDVDPRTIFRYLERERELGGPSTGWLRFFG